MRSANQFHFHAPPSRNLAVSTVLLNPSVLLSAHTPQYNNLIIEYCVLNWECEAVYLNCSAGFISFLYEQNEM